jgi:hypothetical protein
MAQAPLGSDREQLFGDRVDTTDGLHAILIADVGGDRRRCDEETGSGLTE